MDELIRNIVEADKTARSNVEAKKQEKDNVQHLIADERAQVKAKYQEETERCIAEKRAEMDSVLSSQMEQEKKEFDEALNRLEARYETYHEEWVSHIVAKCLDQRGAEK